MRVDVEDPKDEITASEDVNGECRKGEHEEGEDLNEEFVKEDFMKEERGFTATRPFERFGVRNAVNKFMSAVVAAIQYPDRIHEKHGKAGPKRQSSKARGPINWPNPWQAWVKHGR